MIKVYFLKQLKNGVTNTEYTEGSEFISQAISETTEKPDIRRVIIEENVNLANLALKMEEPTDRDTRNYNSLPTESAQVIKRRKAKEQAIIAIKDNGSTTLWGKILYDLAISQGWIEPE